jgi:hypothetical protein
LTQHSTRRQWLAPVERADVIEPQKATLEHVVAPRIFPVHPPREVKQKLLEYSLEELQVLVASELALDLEDTERCPMG